MLPTCLGGLNLNVSIRYPVFGCSGRIGEHVSVELTAEPVAIVVTGAASGLGAATARRLHSDGAHVVLLDLPEAGGELVAAGLGRRASFVAADVRREDDEAVAVGHAKNLGEVRVAVNCAGVGWGSRILGKTGPHSLEFFRAAIDTNLVGSFNVLRLAAARTMHLLGRSTETA
jgi:NAD(P)-dependent dehydrogenase (short-subunit alcohol dehydrogenase family)